MKILTIVGARPQFVKAASFSRAVSEYNKQNSSNKITEEILHTGQHYDYGMSKGFFDEMEIPEPVTNLNVGSGLHGETTGVMLSKIEREIIHRKPDRVLVYGDTNSTLAGALAAAKLHVPVAHVEAGLRSFNKKMPEEINRILTDHVSTILFCPSQSSKKQLAEEGISNGVWVVGDVMYDALLFYKKNAIRPVFENPYILATLHRAENIDNRKRLVSILSAMEKSPLPIVLPLHPRTRNKIKQERLEVSNNIHICEPLSYFSMLGHLEHCSFVITDSGGLQKEAYFFKKKCITVRDETEWIELVQVGMNRVAGCSTEAILESFSWALGEVSSLNNHLYGQGDACKRIVRVLMDSSVQ